MRLWSMATTEIDNTLVTFIYISKQFSLANTEPKIREPFHFEVCFILHIKYMEF